MSNYGYQDPMPVEAFEAQRAELYRRLSLLTLELAEEAGEAAAGFSIVDRGDKGARGPGRFERRIAAMTRAIWAHQVIERLRTGKPSGGGFTELAADSCGKPHSPGSAASLPPGGAGFSAPPGGAGPPGDGVSRTATGSGSDCITETVLNSLSEAPAPDAATRPESAAAPAASHPGLPDGVSPPETGSAPPESMDLKALYERAWRGEPDAIAALAEIVKDEREAISAARAPP